MKKEKKKFHPGLPAGRHRGRQAYWQAEGVGEGVFRSVRSGVLILLKRGLSPIHINRRSLGKQEGRFFDKLFIHLQRPNQIRMQAQEKSRNNKKILEVLSPFQERDIFVLLTPSANG